MNNEVRFKSSNQMVWIFPEESHFKVCCYKKSGGIKEYTADTIDKAMEIARNIFVIEECENDKTETV